MSRTYPYYRREAGEMYRPPAAAPEDAERAAYLARWKDAPEWARWLSEDTEGNCHWWESCPQVFPGALLWCGIGRSDNAPDRLLGSFNAEPRPVQGVGP